jgi:hypothetical protein
MSLTEAQEIFGGVHEDGVNDILRAIFTTRPRYLNYGSVGFVPATSVNVTQMPSIPFPGVPGGIDWAVQIDIPIVDLHPETAGLPPELNMGPEQISVQTTARVCIACDSSRSKGDKGQRDKKHHYPGKLNARCFEVKVFAIGHAERDFGFDGESLVIIVDAIELVDIEPNEIESVIECLLLQILRAVLANVKLPLEALRAGAFSLTLVRGPEVEEDQAKIYGNV